MLQLARKQIIRFALDFEIGEIHTYSGYKGDLIVKVTTKDKNAVIAIRKYALSLGIEEVSIKQNPAFFEFEIYCITVDADVYHLKFDDDNLDHKHYVEDNWKKSGID
ncbi:MAG: hypothetical protein PHX13_04300 [Thiovulaceae bacterium]|nr:hypothetical protein [Sulfurimonadaceae bacterium]